MEISGKQEEQTKYVVGGIDSLLIDDKGKPMVSNEEKERAAGELTNYMEKHKSRFEDFWRAYGPTTRPPIKWDTSRREWVWFGE